MRTAFRVTAELTTPIILSGETFLTLDALLSGVIFEDTGSVERALTEIPLDRTQDVWHGSAVFLSTCALRTAAPFKAGLGMRDIENGSIDRLALKRLAKGARKGGVAKIDTVRDAYQSTLVYYSAYRTPWACWFGCGDIVAVEDLLRDVPAIGKKRRQGYGRVERIEVEPIEEDFSLSRIVGGARQPMRPISLETWGLLYRGGEACSIGCTRSAPPYFQGEAQMCAIPPAREVFWGKVARQSVL